MINAQGVDNGKYAEGIFNILEKAKGNKDTTNNNIDLKVYAGNYNVYAWSGEVVVVPLKGQLAVFSLPSDDPAEGMQLFRHINRDTFRRVRKNGDSLDEELRFERDAGGKVVKMWQHDNFVDKIR